METPASDGNDEAAISGAADSLAAEWLTAERATDRSAMRAVWARAEAAGVPKDDVTLAIYSLRAGRPVTRVARIDLHVGDLWHTYGGWHRVLDARSERMRPDDNPEGLHPFRVAETIQAVTAEDGAQAYGTQPWGTALRYDIAEHEMCFVIRD